MIDNAQTRPSNKNIRYTNREKIISGTNCKLYFKRKSCNGYILCLTIPQ